jgi:hypothetical protein
MAAFKTKGLSPWGIDGVTRLYRFWRVRKRVSRLTIGAKTVVCARSAVEHTEHMLPIKITFLCSS